MRYILAFYEINRTYGGPEEGGWWFDSGQLVRAIQVFRTSDQAEAAAQRANRLFAV